MNKITKQDLIDWIDRPPSNSDLDLINYIINLQNNRDKAIEYMQDFIFEPLLVQEDRKLIMYNENLRNFEKILKGDSDE